MAYDPTEPRDPLGRWVERHGGNPKASLADNIRNLNDAEEYEAATDTENTPTAVIDQIAKTGKDEDNRLEALMNPKASDETLDSFKYSDDPLERTAVAYNPKLDSKTLDMMADDRDLFVRCAVALNRNTPPDALERLEGDSNEDVAEYALLARCRNRSLECCNKGDYDSPRALLGQNRDNLTQSLQISMDYSPMKDYYYAPGPWASTYDDYWESNERLRICDAYTAEVATEAARKGNYDAALQIFEAGHSKWTDDSVGDSFPTRKGRDRTMGMAIDAEQELADQFLYHASPEQCERLRQSGIEHNATGIQNRFDPDNFISTRPMAEHCTVPDRLDRLSRSEDAETRLHVARNPNTSLSTLETLGNDKDEQVSRAAVMEWNHRHDTEQAGGSYSGGFLDDDNGWDDINLE